MACDLSVTKFKFKHMRHRLSGTSSSPQLVSGGSRPISAAARGTKPPVFIGAANPASFVATVSGRGIPPRAARQLDLLQLAAA